MKYNQALCPQVKSVPLRGLRDAFWQQAAVLSPDFCTKTGTAVHCYRLTYEWSRNHSRGLQMCSSRETSCFFQWDVPETKRRGKLTFWCPAGKNQTASLHFEHLICLSAIQYCTKIDGWAWQEEKGRAVSLVRTHQMWAMTPFVQNCVEREKSMEGLQICEQHKLHFRWMWTISDKSLSLNEFEHVSFSDHK